jgi:hypothetical protein
MAASVTSATLGPLDERDEFGVRQLFDGLVNTAEAGGRRQQGGQHQAGLADRRDALAGASGGQA